MIGALEAEILVLRGGKREGEKDLSGTNNVDELKIQIAHLQEKVEKVKGEREERERRREGEYKKLRLFSSSASSSSCI